MPRKIGLPHIYDNVLLDRASLKRQDENWLMHRRRDPETLVIAFNGLLVETEKAADRPRLRYRRAGELSTALADDTIFLGMLGDRALFAIDLGADHPSLEETVELRSIGSLLEQGDAGILAYGRALFHWHRGHKFCGFCGGHTKVVQGGHARRCPACGKEVFPRTDPAVIVLVTHGEFCLLGRSARFPPGMYSTLAGFVEPGESLEHCLRREIFEEAGVELIDWDYRSSQPWPFPQSLMLGFRARAKDRRLNIDKDELDDAVWLHKSELLSGECPVKLPSADSIARALIEDWLADQD